ncbi:MAG: hypothetical protein QM775_27880 [Pirellulales bacterium]
MRKIPIAILWLTMAAVAYVAIDLAIYPMELFVAVNASEKSETVPWDFYANTARVAMDESRRICGTLLLVAGVQLFAVIWLTIAGTNGSPATRE